MRQVRALVARFVPEGAVLLSILLFGSYLMGFLRTRVLAQTFGAGTELDAYNQAFQLPEIVFDVLVEGGLAAAFIPIFLKLRSGGGPDADRFGRTILTAAVAIMGVASVVMFVFAEATAAVITPGFGPTARELYVGLFRLMLVTPILFTASLTLGQVLLAEQRMFWYGIAPLLYNGGIIAGALVLSDPLGIYAPAVGAIVGALLHLATRLIGLRPSRFRIRPAWAIRLPAITEYVRLMLPKMVSHPIEGATFTFFGAAATLLAAGSAATVSIARDFGSPPVVVIGVAFGLAAFPGLSVAHAEGDRREFVRLLRTSLVSVLALTSAAAVAIAVLADLVIGRLLGGGAFDADDVALTASVLVVFAIAIPFESVTHLLSRAIYATRHTLLQVLSSLVGLAVTVATTLSLLPAIGILAMPTGFAVGQACKAVLLGASLAWRMRTIDAAAPAEAPSAAGGPG